MTFIAEVALNGIPIGLRNLIPLKERGGQFGLSEPICRKVGVDTGDRVHIEMRKLEDTTPRELQELLENHGRARRAWDSPKDSQKGSEWNRPGFNR